jgi:hypothetical protein
MAMPHLNQVGFISTLNHHFGWLENMLFPTCLKVQGGAPPCLLVLTINALDIYIYMHHKPQ